MLLKNLLPKNLKLNSLNQKIKDISSDSRKVKKGSLFFALSGKNFDGSKFIDEAIKKGAAAVVVSKYYQTSSLQTSTLSKSASSSQRKLGSHDALRDPSVSWDDERNLDNKVIYDNEIIWDNNFTKVPIIKTDIPHQLMIYVLKKFYSDLPQNIFAVTGTNGKTSVAEFTRQILELAGKRSASIGTLGVVCNDKKILKKIDYNFLTTPDIVSLYKNLSILKKSGINNIAMEASSIGIEQGRMDGLKISVGIFTNFSQDHLDYHGTMENYFSAKMMLYSNLMKKGLAVINSDISEYNKINDICKKSGHKIISYGKKSSQVKLKKIKSSGSFQEIEFSINGKNNKAELSVIGDFQVMNVLSALSAVYFYYKLSDSKLDKIIHNFSSLKPALGRMQKIATLKNNAEIYIDFAHTPDALENILTNAKKSAKARILVLFGCGGDRDNKKRPLMGKIVSNLADIAIVTDDNPRTEKPEEIRKQILSGCNLKNTIEIPNRKIAIEKSIQMLEKNDILILAGKGHEKYQIIGEAKHEFDEEEIVKNFLDSIV